MIVADTFYGAEQISSMPCIPEITHIKVPAAVCSKNSFNSKTVPSNDRASEGSDSKRRKRQRKASRSPRTNQPSLRSVDNDERPRTVRQSSDNRRSVGDSKMKRSRRLCSDSPTVSALLQDAKFFLMKSGNMANINISQCSNVWSTAKSVDQLLSKSYHRYNDVILIFSADGSGAFQGMARLCSSSRRDTVPVGWVVPPDVPEDELGGFFRLQWITRRELPFTNVADVRNPLDEDKLIKNGRNGTEIQRGVARRLCRLFPLDNDIDLEKVFGGSPLTSSSQARVRERVHRSPSPPPTSSRPVRERRRRSPSPPRRSLRSDGERRHSQSPSPAPRKKQPRTRSKENRTTSLTRSSSSDRRSRERTMGATSSVVSDRSSRLRAVKPRSSSRQRPQQQSLLLRLLGSGSGDTLRMIFRHLTSPKDKVRIERVCRAFRQHAATFEAWSNVCELVVANNGANCLVNKDKIFSSSLLSAAIQAILLRSRSLQGIQLYLCRNSIAYSSVVKSVLHNGANYYRNVRELYFDGRLSLECSSDILLLIELFKRQVNGLFLSEILMSYKMSQMWKIVGECVALKAFAYVSSQDQVTSDIIRMALVGKPIESLYICAPRIQAGDLSEIICSLAVGPSSMYISNHNISLSDFMMCLPTVQSACLQKLSYHHFGDVQDLMCSAIMQIPRAFPQLKLVSLKFSETDFKYEDAVVLVVSYLSILRETSNNHRPAIFKLFVRSSLNASGWEQVFASLASDQRSKIEAIDECKYHIHCSEYSLFFEHNIFSFV